MRSEQHARGRVTEAKCGEVTGAERIGPRRWLRRSFACLGVKRSGALWLGFNRILLAHTVRSECGSWESRRKTLQLSGQGRWWPGQGTAARGGQR